MTFFVKCDDCGKTQEAAYNTSGDPINPFNSNEGGSWYSRTKDGKIIHACCHEHIPKDDMVWPA